MPDNKITEVEKLDLLLKHTGAELMGVTLGDEEASAEEIAKVIRKSLIRKMKQEI